MSFKYADAPAPIPMEPKKIGKCCMCRKPRGNVIATNARYPNAGTCDRCGIYQSIHKITHTLTLEELQGPGFTLTVNGEKR